MPRPTRIEYEDAYYHVMNRGRRRQTIFHTEAYYLAFLDLLGEAHERFGVVIHGYCLMGNHYHLLLQTPQGNLGRIMRHINGVFTQRFNRLKRTDGTLFRGRYKAILVDEENYLLQLSRYIHRNPVESTSPLVRKLETYRWSSYPAYINHTKSPSWLQREFLYSLMGQRQKYQAYRTYVEAGVDDEIKDFYNRDRTAAVLGDDTFRTWVRESHMQDVDEKAFVAQVFPNTLSIDRIIQLVAKYYKVDATKLTTVVKGPQKGLLARKLAMYLCQQLGGHRLADIMDAFGLSNVGSVSFITTQIRKRRHEDPALAKTVQRLKQYAIKNAT